MELSGGVTMTDDRARIGDLMRHYQSGSWALVLTDPFSPNKVAAVPGNWESWVDLLWLDDQVADRYDRCGEEWVTQSFERVARLED